MDMVVDMDMDLVWKCDGVGWWLDVYFGVWEDRGGWSLPSTCIVGWRFGLGIICLVKLAVG